ncbi:MAG: alpha/beta hydrolase [Myxococcales bacterium]
MPAETVLFLPGASGNLDFWRPVSERLRHPGARRFIGYPGLGGVPVDEEVSRLDDLITWVTRAMTGPVDLVAQSMGGIVAVRAALEKPELVRRLVLTATSGGIDLSSFGAVDWRPEFRARNPGAPGWFMDDCTELSTRLHEITVPVLLIWGDSDPISPVAVGERLAELLPRSELVVLNGGTHDLAFERADEVAALIERHLQREHLHGL